MFILISGEVAFITTLLWTDSAQREFSDLFSLEERQQDAVNVTSCPLPANVILNGLLCTNENSSLCRKIKPACDILMFWSLSQTGPSWPASLE